MQGHIKSIGNLFVDIIIFNVCENGFFIRVIRILGISVEPYFSVFVFAVLVQRQQYDIVLGLYGENGNDGTVDNSAVFQLQLGGRVFIFIAFFFTHGNPPDMFIGCNSTLFLYYNRLRIFLQCLFFLHLQTIIKMDKETVSDRKLEDGV